MWDSLSDGNFCNALAHIDSRHLSNKCKGRSKLTMSPESGLSNWACDARQLVVSHMSNLTILPVLYWISKVGCYYLLASIENHSKFRPSSYRKKSPTTLQLRNNTKNALTAFHGGKCRKYEQQILRVHIYQSSLEIERQHLAFFAAVFFIFWYHGQFRSNI